MQNTKRQRNIRKQKEVNKKKKCEENKKDHEAEKLEETAPETLPSETKVPTTFYKVYKLNCKT